MKAFLIGMSLVVGVYMSGCQNQSKAQESDHQVQNEDANDEVIAPEVKIMANEHVDKGQQETISALVTYGEEFVEDAEVVFEIKHDEVSEKITANLIQEGKYAIDYTFESDGYYQVIAHTNAKGYHIMPSIQIQVGDIGDTLHHDEESETTHHHHE
ncbi:MAG TPA: FixH family protein [Metabacillus sp.]|nr:FixH family protein [Metabacillus sp.]